MMNRKTAEKMSSEEFELGINFKDGLLKTHRGKYYFCMPWSNRICKGVREERAVNLH
jgi:hypothetical protein